MQLLPSNIVGNAGGPYKTLKGAMNVHDADVHNVVINRYFHQHTTPVTTLAVAVVGDGAENQITVADATGFTAGAFIHINTSSIETTHPQIIGAPVGNVITLDRRLDKAHAIGDEVNVSLVNMAPQVGTLAAPQEYWVQPPPGEIWHITRVLFEMTHATSGDLGKFGGIAALTNGAVMRVRINGVFGTLTNWKTNGNIKTDMFDVVFDIRSGGGGDFGTSGRGTFIRSGAVVRLDGDTEDRLQLFIQDDISSLITFTMKAQGHVEGI